MQQERSAMVNVKVIRLSDKVRPRRRRVPDETMVFDGTVPETIEPMIKAINALWPKLDKNLRYMANRNKDGVKPQDWYDEMVEALTFFRPERKHH
jgi:hypothetical protein